MYVNSRFFLIVYDYNNGNGIFHNEHSIHLTAADVQKEIDAKQDHHAVTVFDCEDGRMEECTGAFFHENTTTDKEEHGFDASDYGIGTRYSA
jgi:hypothetical protein